MVSYGTHTQPAEVAVVFLWLIYENPGILAHYIEHNSCVFGQWPRFMNETFERMWSRDVVIICDVEQYFEWQTLHLNIVQIYPVSVGYLRKIPVERRGKYLTVLETGIFRK